MKRKRYSIMVVQAGSKNETELCQVATEPQALVAAAREKTMRMVTGNGRVVHVPRYDSIRVVDHEAEREGG